VKVLESTSDGLALAEAFDDYKAWLKNGKKAPGSEPPAPDLGKKEKDKRLAAAVEPEGKPRAPGPSAPIRRGSLRGWLQRSSKSALGVTPTKE
jgi:hypothetical protein